MILYADVLFFINFSMDFLSLFFCGKLLHKKLQKRRMVLSSLIGAFFATVLVLINSDSIMSIILSVFFAMLMIKVAFEEKKLKHTAVLAVMYLFVSATLGGTMSIVYAVLNSVMGKYIAENSYGINYDGARTFLILGVTAAIALALFKIFNSRKNVKSVRLKIILNGQEYLLSGMCDTGNLLCEPFSGRRVILVGEESSIGKKINEIEDIYKKYIPYRDVSNDGMLKGVVPSLIEIEGSIKDAVVATVKNKSFNGYDALVPSALV